MNTIKHNLTSAGFALLLVLPLQLPAQKETAPPPATSPVPRPTGQKSAGPSSTGQRATGQRAAGQRATGPRSATTAARPDAIKLPANIPIAKGVLRTEYALRYIDVLVGTGPPAEQGMLYSVHYTGWLYDGTKFDSSLDRGTPIQFQQGQHRVISGWDTGFEGMKVGGKRRLFIPYQLAYGDTGKGPIPAKSNLIFDVELVDMKDPNAAQPASTPPQ